jgi:hypothetical protein
MSAGPVVATLVLLESVLMLAAIHWLISGLRHADLTERPPVVPLGAVLELPGPRDGGGRRSDDRAGATP